MAQSQEQRYPSRLRGPPSRLIHQTLTQQKAASRSQPSQRDIVETRQKNFLSAIFSEINEHCTSSSTQTLIPIQDKIRLVRSASFLSRLSEDRRFTWLESIQVSEQLSARLKAALTTFLSDAQQANGTEALRLLEVVSVLGWYVTCICLFSTTFRNSLTQDDQIDSLAWKDKPTLLLQNSSSLELFAKTRGLEVQQPLHTSDEHFKTLLGSKSFKLTKKETVNVNAGNFGILDRDLRERCDIDRKLRNPHLWVRPRDSGAAAVRPTLRFPNSEDLKRDFPARRKDAKITNFQEDISDSIVLGRYEWPNQSQWVEKDPRYSGFEKKCHVCKAWRKPSPKRPKAKDPRFIRCECRLKNLVDYTGTPLIELFDTGRVGTGVRALQNIDEGLVLDEYVGEIYPASKKGDADMVAPRYGLEGGCMYRLKLRVEKRHAQRRLKRCAVEEIDGVETCPAKKRRSSKAFDSPQRDHPNGNEEPADSDDDVPMAGKLADLDQVEYVDYVVDSALKGNWTRYINHSCDPNTEFWGANIGMRWLPLVRTLRDIGFGDDITVDYGRQYLDTLKVPCRCSVSTCLRWQEAGQRCCEFLGDAVEKGEGPDWIGGRQEKRGEKDAPPEFLLDKVIPVTDKEVLKRARRARADQQKKEGVTGKATKASEPKRARKGLANRKGKSEGEVRRGDEQG